MRIRCPSKRVNSNSILVQLQAAGASTQPPQVALDELARLAQAELAETPRLSEGGKRWQAVERVAAGGGKRTVEAAGRVAEEIKARERERLAECKQRLGEFAAIDSVLTGASPVLALGSLCAT